MAQIDKLDDTVYVAGQITPADIPEIAEQGIKLIVNNRPDGEDPMSQPTAAALEDAAIQHGMRFVNIQFPTAHMAPADTADLAEVLKNESEPMLIFCRTGTRSTVLWASARLALGDPLHEVVEKAARAGHDLHSMLPLIEKLAKAAQQEM